MPRRAKLDDVLPETVAFTNWDKVQTARWRERVTVLASVLYDKKIGPPHGPIDATRGRLLSLMVVAKLQGGSADVAGWLRECSDKVAARIDLKRWLDNGLVKTQVVSSAVSTTVREETLHDTPPKRGAQRGRARQAQLEAPLDVGSNPNGSAANGSGSTNWIAPAVEAWERNHDGAPPPKRVFAKMRTEFSGLYRAGKTPADIGARFELWLAVRDPQRHQYVEDFVIAWAELDPTRDSAEYLLDLSERYGPRHSQH